MEPDAIVVGTGPNGLAAAVTLGRAGLKVALYEARETIGGGLRTESLFDPEIEHDLCSAVHPMAVASPFFRRFDLASRGVTMLSTPVSYAHPLKDGRAGLAYRDLEATCEHLGPDGERWRRLMQPLLEHSQELVDFILSGQRSLPRSLSVPALLASRMLVHGTALAPRHFSTEEARSLLTGVAAHAVGRLPSLASGAVAVLLGHLAHAGGWPVPESGSARIADALAADIVACGGTFHTSHHVTRLEELPRAKTVLLDVSPKAFARIAADRLPLRYRRALARFRYGPAAAKVDFLVSEPIPWANPAVGQAATVHLGGTQAEMYRAETAAAAGIRPEEPFVLLVDPAAADPGRARAGRRPVWAYAHVPNGDAVDPAATVTACIERYAPGFTDTVIHRRGISGAKYEAYNPNYVGGDIGGGAMTLWQSLMRPVPRFDPYRTPLHGVYLCSASTPPGPSVHGMSGHLAALSALRREFGVRTAPDIGPR
ncbi:phytoene desaturase family protein [Streptomyces sp. SLBN-115]|uniref:phytoene desaturase family protein n=1 Tax=Streptomyces sp. SLBN-115 TaxID=2768453 RepID=UPI001154C115|nr:NAD(P)/FAD-dependent oxidoreductase [Streptomyces sp. SLBN-115]TQJ57741.1 phytoene dehydrogenase-like protein [Streptomyces sp. SLBN-115]